MTLNYSAKITVDAKDKNNAIFDSVNTDNEFYPENPVKTKIKLVYFNTVLFILYVFYYLFLKSSIILNCQI